MNTHIPSAMSAGFCLGLAVSAFINGDYLIALIYFFLALVNIAFMIA